MKNNIIGYLQQNFQKFIFLAEKILFPLKKIKSDQKSLTELAANKITYTPKNR